MAINLENIPGVKLENINENALGVLPAGIGERFLILGTAPQGMSSLYLATDTSNAASEFGSSQLIKGMYEAMQGGASSVILLRIGATPCTLYHIGDALGSGGYMVRTYRRDEDAGEVYSVYYDDATDRLVVWNNLTGYVVYDNDSSNPVDRGEVIVSGSRAAAGGPDIGGPSSGVNLEDVSAAGTSFVAGTDGNNPSRMELYEYLDDAYRKLLAERIDYVVPMDVYMDDRNIVDGDTFSADYLAAITDGDDYPTAGSSDDILGKLFIETYLGKRYYFWDLDSDGEAELYPDGIGHASATTKISGESLSASDFHEVNFAYQLGYFCHKMTYNNRFCLGSIGVRPPDSSAIEDLAVWIGDKPTFTLQADGSEKIENLSDNGTGLLGHKYHGGEYAWRTGLAYGGMPLTSVQFPDGTIQYDQNGYAIDLGRYISTVASYVKFFNAYDPTGRGYTSTMAAFYMGFVSGLDEQNSPTNKVVTGVQKIFDLDIEWVDDLGEMGYIFAYETDRGLTINMANTSALPSSDYRALTTVRIVKLCCNAVRVAAYPFIGRSFNDAEKVALENALHRRLDKLVETGYIRRKELVLSQTPRQRVIGEAKLDLVLVPAFELRRVSTSINLKPV